MRQSIATLDEQGYLLFCTCELAGGFLRREAVEALQAGDVLTLLAEPQNEYDPDAVVVLAPNGEKLGYITAATGNRENKLVAAVMARLPVVCIVGVVDHNPQHLRNRVRLSVYAHVI